MSKNLKRKSPLTLLEIMIVISLITLILGVVGYNMKGVLDKGKKFKTEQAIERLNNIFQISMAEGATPETIAQKPEDFIKKHGYTKNPDDFLKDAWGHNFRFTALKEDVQVKSEGLEAYERKNR